MFLKKKNFYLWQHYCQQDSQEEEEEEELNGTVPSVEKFYNK